MHIFIILDVYGYLDVPKGLRCTPGAKSPQATKISDPHDPPNGVQRRVHVLPSALGCRRAGVLGAVIQRPPELLERSRLGRAGRQGVERRRNDRRPHVLIAAAVQRVREDGERLAPPLQPPRFSESSSVNISL
jgi:hypothetical protein